MFDKNFIIGNTPMIKINYEYNGKEKHIYTKLEYFNLTGSIKDRVAFYIITNAKKRGVLKEGMPIIEATSGNTGISLSALGRFFKHDVYIFMPDWVSTERVKLMKRNGAEVILISEKEGGFIKCVEESKKLAKKLNGFFFFFFSNIDNFLAHYETTAEELINYVPGNIDGFVSGVGTGGTLMGVGRKLKNINSNCRIVAIEPDKMPILSIGRKMAQHKIEGIGDDFVPDLVDKSLIDEIILVDDDDSINMSRILSRDLGLGVGISAGANLIGCIILNDDFDGNVATVFPDDNKKYLSTELANDIVYNKSFVSCKVKLKNYEVIC